MTFRGESISAAKKSALLEANFSDLHYKFFLFDLPVICCKRFNFLEVDTIHHKYFQRSFVLVVDCWDAAKSFYDAFGF